MFNNRYLEKNRNARISHRRLRNGNLRTETTGRDSGIGVTVTRDQKTGATRFSLKTENGLVVRLGGHEARTLFRVLARHYDVADQSLEPVIQPFNESTF